MSTISKLKPFDKIEIIRKCSGLSSTQKLILLVIATHLGKNEFCFLSFNTLQKECSLKNRTALSDNLTSLINVDILWKINPGPKFKSNRYGINFNLLVRDAYQCGTPRLPDQCGTRTKVVRDTYPKRNINKVKENKEELSMNKSEKALKAIDEIRKKCNIKKRD